MSDAYSSPAGTGRAAPGGAGQGSAGSTDVVTQLLSIVRHLSNNGILLQGLTAAVQKQSVGGFTVATLPTSPAIGTLVYVTDGTAALAWGATVTGGGTTRYLVWWNGTNWTVVGK